jgi:hypothetical protein
VASGSGGWWAYRYSGWFTPASQRTATAQDDVQPSTFVSRHVVEEVVGDVDSDRETLTKHGFLDLSYEQLSTVEKVNYEIHFAKNVFDLLARTAVSGVDFTRVQLKSFGQFTGSGQCGSREKIGRFFEGMKREKITLRPKPETIIRGSDDGFRFTITGDTRFGLNLESPFLLGPDEIMAYRDCEETIRRIYSVAKDEGLRGNEPSFMEAAMADSYRRMRYQYSATGSYNSVVSFINTLYARRIPCAFEQFTLTALSASSVKMETGILLTTQR